jgi:hypothetical protein
VEGESNYYFGPALIAAGTESLARSGIGGDTHRISSPRPSGRVDTHVQIGREAAVAERGMELASTGPDGTSETEPSAPDREPRTGIGWMSAARSRIKRRGWRPLELAGDGRDGVSVVVIEERMNRRGCRAHHSFWCSRAWFSWPNHAAVKGRISALFGAPARA